MTRLIEQLEKAQGRSEFLISVVCDIRGFSQFSTVHESPDLAMFIKRFYLKLLQVYFKDVRYAKPTGDGLLMVFKYDESTLPSVADYVLSTCFQVLSDFPKMFKDDPMINFQTPQCLGFGIARGTACCLYSKNQIIDYSGQLLNLTARLNDIARPQGIVIDGTFLESIIPSKFRNHFKRKRAYLKSLAEEFPKDVFCSSDVSLPPYAQSPLSTNEWILERKEILTKDILTLGSKYNMVLSHEVYSTDKMKLEITYPNIKVSGYTTYRSYPSFEYLKDAKGSRLEIQLERVKSIANDNQLPPDSKIGFDFQYVPKLKKKKRGA